MGATKSTAEFWALYNQGKHAEVLATVQTELSGWNDHGAVSGWDQELVYELYALQAWCYYHLKNYAEALKSIESANGQKQARYCMMTILAYAKGFEDDAKLERMAEQLDPNDLLDYLNIVNAIFIRARAKDSTISETRIAAEVRKVQSLQIAVERKTLHGHILNNASRFYLEKGNETDVFAALGLLQMAVALYGAVANWHHRAAAHFWLSKIYEKIGQKKLTHDAAVASFELWLLQCELDPKNEGHKKSLATAQTRLQDTAEALKATVI